ncbi:sulfite exporter TauE/SafE family protein [Bradyrhizobium jicamae]|uniref:sulfite exporter TauE/SafE family protein n=1 Tax=Bradyrhizobium jicamae TaxID=280332 RepID=UPI001BA608FB|nr:sulfite exporter TauE/SafE family protein [Bradyrhizobium jicamae]MBR0758061.1 sulfite exporter TauE/SafE family protein [Bradyrhizobium jicamae]
MLGASTYLIAGLAVMCLGLSKGGFIGFGMIATPLLALVIPPLQAAALLLPIMLTQDVFSAWVFRHECDYRTLAIMLPGTLVGIAIAWIFATHIEQAMVRLTVGLVGVSFAISHWGGLKMRAKSSGAGLLWGTVAGFTGTLANAGGPPFLVFALSQDFSKMVFVGTAAMFFLALNAVKLGPFFALGQFSSENLMTSLLLLPLAIVANAVAIRLVRRIPSSAFYRVSYALVFAVSAGLIWQGITQHGR